MKVRSQSQWLCASVVAGFLGFFSALWSSQALAQDDPQPARAEQPIAAIGHGGFFDATGKQITLTQEFVAQAQAWYRADLSAGLDERRQFEFTQFENALFDGVPAKGQTRLIVEQRALEWLFVSSGRGKDDYRTLGKLRALDFALSFRLPERAGQTVAQGVPYVLPPDLAKKLADVRAKQAGAGAGINTATTNSGVAYTNECIAAGVPIPPSIGVMDPAGLAGWKSQGFIPTGLQFIVGTPAELRTYRSLSPMGMCYALPRYTNAFLTTVALDGVICLSQVTSKVCIWDNQMSTVGFMFPAGATIPIGAPNLMVDPAGRYQAGGFELLNGSGGICTDCHAGENPFITHPKANLGSYLWETLSQPPQNLPTFAPNRYDPLVPAAWPQNQWSQSGPTVPPVCGACHIKLSAGRFPHLSNQIPDYCSVILPQAIATTMPPSLPGSASVVATAFKNAYCGAPPDYTAGDAGDPHITTTNGVNYDFQAAGEFTVLKNSDTGFEVQARQSPVQTTFTPPANPYTGLASCVSLNTAVAARVGTRRVSYQPIRGSANEAMQVRIDGAPVQLTPTPINLGGGNTIVRAGAGNGLRIDYADGTDLTVTSRYWASQGYWYLDVDVRRTPAREGIAGPVLAGDWLPRAPDGSSFGPRPVPLANRHVVLNQTFADAWRVTSATSLFDYAPGTSTADFTDRNWPTPSGQPCVTPLLPPRPALTTMQPQLAQEACRGIEKATKRANCIFDVTVMGDRAFALGYLPVQGTGDGRQGQSTTLDE